MFGLRKKSDVPCKEKNIGGSENDKNGNVIWWRLWNKLTKGKK